MRESAPDPGQLSREALERAGGAMGKAENCPVQVPLLKRPRVTGEVELVHAENGQSCGVCVSEEIAAAATRFLGGNPQ